MASDDRPGGETGATVVLALVADIGVALAKIAGGLITGSPSLLSEAAHSVADTLNQVFLLVSLRKAEKPADRTHPFGYGKERFFWSLIAAVGIFVSGAGFSLYQGVDAVLNPGAVESGSEFVVVYVVLAISLLLDGASLLKALRQVTGEARAAGRSLGAYVERSPDPTVKAVASEDLAAVLGIAFALVGSVLHQLTGNAVFDAAGSFAIAGLLAYVAIRLGRDTKDLLLDESADPAVRLLVVNVLAEHHEVERISEIITMQLGPAAVLVTARLQFREDLRARELEEVCTVMELEMRERMPSITQVFLDPSAVSDEQHALALEHLELNLDEVRMLDGPGSDVVRDLERARAARTRSGRRASMRP